MSDNPMLADMAAEDGTEVHVAPHEAASLSSERPAWLPEKFASAEDLAKAYSELEKARGQEQEPASSPTTDSAVPANNDEAEVFVEKAGLNFENFATEFREYGELSRLSYDELARAGISREVVDGYIAGQQAIANGIRNEVFSAAGGADQYADMVAWAGSNLSPNEIRAYDAVMGTGNTAQMKLAVDGLKSRFEAANGVSPKLMGGHSGHGSQSAGDVYSSRAQMVADMSSDRYRTDASFRAEVAARLGRSNIM